MKTYRIDENGETYWTGRAHDCDHALEKCYDDGGPGSLVTVTLYEWGTVKYGPTMKGKGWVKRWEGSI